MFCAKAIRILAGRKSAKLTVLCNNSSRRFLHSLKVRNFANEARAAQRLLSRSQIVPSDLARMCGARFLHTSDGRRQEEGKEKKNEDDEKDRMLSALKTAVAFFAAPMLLIFLFRSGERRDTKNQLETGQRSGEARTESRFCFSTLSFVQVELWERSAGLISTRTCC